MYGVDVPRRRKVIRLVRTIGTGRGVGDAQSILANEQVFASNPYLQSPAFLAQQAKMLQTDCSVSPNDPACQVAQLTGDVNTGYNAVADTVLNLKNWCEQNVQNNAIWNTPLDTQNCDSMEPKAPLVAQAIVNAAAATTPPPAPPPAAQFQAPPPPAPPAPPPPTVNPLDLALNPSKLQNVIQYFSQLAANTPPAAPAPAAPKLSIALANLSRPGQSNFKVGELWQIVITGAPNAAVVGSASQDGKSLGSTNYGTTDSTGRFTLSGTMHAEDSGSWIENWTVGGQALPALNFTVAAAQPGSSQNFAPSGSPAPAPALSSSFPWGAIAAVGAAIAAGVLIFGHESA